MHQGNWKCSSCGGAITELPFQPRSESGLTCRTCYGKQKDKEKGVNPASEIPEMSVASEPQDDFPDYAETTSEPAPHEDFAPNMAPVTNEKPKFAGKWKCATCGNDIASLPFEPRDVTNLKCLDCFKRSKQ